MVPVRQVGPRWTDYRFGYRFALRIPRLNARKRDRVRQFANRAESAKMLKTKDFQAFRRAETLAC